MKTFLIADDSTEKIAMLQSLLESVGWRGTTYIAQTTEEAMKWIDLDPTNDMVVGDRHVTTAWGRDYTDVPPLKGVIYTEGRTTGLEVSVDVTPVDTLS